MALSLAFAGHRVWCPPLQVVLTLADAPTDAVVFAQSSPPTDHSSFAVRRREHPRHCSLRVRPVSRVGTGGPAEPPAIVALQRLVVTESGGSLDQGGYQLGEGWAELVDPHRFAIRVCEGAGELRWDGVAVGALRLPLETSPDGGIAEVRWNEQPAQRVDLRTDGSGWTELRLDAVGPCADHVLAVGFPYDAPMVRLSHGGGRLVQCRVTWGEHTLTCVNCDLALGTEPVWLSLGDDLVARVIEQMAWNAARVAWRTTILLLLGIVLGLPIAAGLAHRLDGLQLAVVSWIAGACLPVVMAMSLTRLRLSGLQSFNASLAVCGLLLVLWLVIRPAMLLRSLRETTRALASRDVLVSVGIGFFGASLFLFPIFSHPSWYLGWFFNDAPFYINHATAFADLPLNVTQAPDWRTASPIGHLPYPAFRFEERSGDFLMLGVLARTWGCSAREAYPQLHFALWALLPLTLRPLFARLAPHCPVWLPALIVSCSGALFSVVAYTWMAQYLSVMQLLQAVVVTALYLHELRSGPMPRLVHAAFIVALSLILAAQAGTFPAQVFFPALLALVLVGRAFQEWSFRPVWILCCVAGGSLLACNLGLLPLVRAPLDQSFNLRFMDNLARRWIFPFYRDHGVTLRTAAGFRDVQRYSQRAAEICTDLPCPPTTGWRPTFERKLTRGGLIALIALALTGLGATMRRGGSGHALGLTAAACVLLCVALYASDQVYLYGKMFFTAGVVLWVCAAVGGALLVGSGRRALRWPATAALALIVALNLRTAWWGNCVWLLPDGHPVRNASFVSIASADLCEAVAAIERLAARHPGAPAFLRGCDPRGPATGRDEVLEDLLLNAFGPRQMLVNADDERTLSSGSAFGLLFRGDELPRDLLDRGRLVLENGRFLVYEFTPGSELARR